MEGENVPEFIEKEQGNNIIAGRNPVMEAIKSGRSIDKLYVQSGDKRLNKTDYCSCTQKQNSYNRGRQTKA